MITENQPPLRPSRCAPIGQVVTLAHRSSVLADNPLGDPVERTLKVWLPPAAQRGETVPAIWYLAAYTNSGAAQDNWQGFKENLPQRLDRLYDEGRLPPVAVLFPDAFTALGGNQYLNSAAVGRYADYIHEELIPFAEAELPLRAGRKHRAVMGKSSGGYAALVYGMRHPEYWGSIASHAGDCGFDWVYKPDFPTVAANLARYNGDIRGFLQRFWRSRTNGGADFLTLMHCGLAATYDPDPDHPEHIVLPFDLRTLEMDEARWARWLANDPLRLVATHGEQLRQLNGVFIDCGARDQYRIQYGTRALAQQLTNLGVEHQYEEFDGTHSNIDHRLDESIPFLAQRLHS